MTRVDTKVFIAFDLSVSGVGDFFTLNDAVKGELDNTTYVLAGDVLTDVTSDVRSVTLRRGRSWQLDRFQTGDANVVLSNQDRQYDPTNGPATAVRTNLIPNPSFEVDLSNWSASTTPTNMNNFTRGSASISTTSNAAFGSQALRVDTSPVAQPGPFYFSHPLGAHTVLSLDANTQYTISAYVFPDIGNAVTVRARDVTNGISGTFGISSAPQFGTSSATIEGWQRISSTITTGANPAQVYVEYWAGSNLNPDIFGTPNYSPSRFYVDAVLAERTNVVQPYFDGSVADGAILSASVAWTGTAHNSVSTLGYGVPGTGSPYFPSVKPRKEIVVQIEGDRAFTGIVEDWDYQYSIGGDSTAVVRAADGFSRIAQSLVNPVTVPSESTGSRIARILDLPEVSWPAFLRDIDTGAATLAAASVGNGTDTVNALDYLQRVEEAEPGALFIDGAGVLRFLSRSRSQNITNVIFGDSISNVSESVLQSEEYNANVGYAASVAYSGAFVVQQVTGIPFVNIAVDYGTQNVRNTVIISREGGALVTASDAVSIAEYGPISYEVTDSLLGTDEQVADLAQWIVGLYAQPKIRIDSITVDIGSLTPSDRSQVLNLELGDVVRLVWTPQKIGNPIDRYVQVDALEHSISPSDHYVTLDLSDALPGFILGSSVFGVLDSSKLGF